MNKTTSIVIGIILIVLALIIIYLTQKFPNPKIRLFVLFASIICASAGMSLMIEKSDSTSSSSVGCPSGQSCQANNSSSTIPSGTIIAFGGEEIPAGWLLCDGSAYSSTNYPDLFQSISTNYGTGESQGNFNVPDLRGMFLRGVNGTSANDPDVESRVSMNGGKAGNNLGSYQADDFASHTHFQSYTTYQQNPINSWNTPFSILNTDGSGQKVSSQPSTSSSGGNESRPKNVYVNFIIKT